MTRAIQRRSTRLTGARTAILSMAWLSVVYLARSALGLYYEPLAVLATVPVLALIYVYSLSHRSRATAVLALAATLVVMLVISVAFVIPKGSAA